MDMTFAVASYNQETTVLETLESIKHQVISYGVGKEVQLVIADDASTDRTYYIENKWAEINRDHFSKIDILPSIQHFGINKNTLRIVNHIEGKRWKGIAGDDLLADTNVFEIIEVDEKDLYINSYFIFNSSNEISLDILHYLYWGSTFEELQNYSRFEMNLISIQSLIHAQSLIDDGFRKALSQYSYLEDIPAWEYLMNKSQLNIQYNNVPIILYRKAENNISLNGTKNPFYDDFKHDAIKIYSDKIYRANGFLEKYVAYMIKNRRFGGSVLFSIMNPFIYYHKLQIWRNRN